MHFTSLERNEIYTQYVIVDAGPSNTACIASRKKKQSSLLAAGCSAIALIATITWALGNRSSTAKHFMLKTGDEFDTEGSDNRMHKISDTMGKYYNNILVGQSSICSPGSFLRKNEKGRTSCVNCPAGQVDLKCPSGLFKKFSDWSIYINLFSFNSGAIMTCRIPAHLIRRVDLELSRSHNVFADQVYFGSRFWKGTCTFAIPWKQLSMMCRLRG